jgi:hypothetical protein
MMATIKLRSVSTTTASSPSLDITCILRMHIDKAALAHLGERQTEVHFMSRKQLHSGGTVFDPQKRHSFLFLLVV